MTFPRMPDPGGATALAALAERFYRFASEVLNYMRLQPALEIKTFSSVGHYPIYVETRVAPVAGVICCRAYHELQGEQTIAGAGVAWRASEDTEQPGIVIDSIEGVSESVGTAGENVTVTIIIFGEVA